MNELVKAGRKSKDRSPNFPFISLEAALDKARLFYAKEKRGSAVGSVVASHWGYSASSSGLLQTIGALKSYGLFSEQGSSAGRRLALTERALRILLDERQESSERDQLLRDAAQSPAVAGHIYALWPDELPSQQSIHHFLTLEKRFNPDTARKVTKIVLANHAFVRFDALRSDSISATIESDTVSAGAQVMNPSLAVGRQEIVPPAIAVRSVVSTDPNVEKIKGPNGVSITLQFGSEPSTSTFEFLKMYADLRILSLKDVASSDTEA